ncbi:restriction endonuclease subunit S [Providencia vermicola]|uniref:restriction endonuclease subunit S n=1 Tax=Providencia vermicola TaxID=333965 RepID=UPI00280CA2E7|nr:restriction endonuclease subunit S [Providencia stuartii]
MSEWQNVTLKQLVKFGNGKSRPKEKGKIPVYGGNGILDFTDKYNYAGETLIIGRVGAYCGATYLEKSPVWVSDNALSAKALDNNNPDYLYYLFKYLDLNQYAQGSSHPLLTQTLLNAIEVETTLDGIEQKAIASVLSSLDDKINLLHRQNKTLEAMAETLFRQWFVEKAQNYWQSGILKDEFNFIMGQSPKGSSFNEENIGTPMFQGNADFGFRFPKERVYTTEPTRFAQKFDTLISVRAPVGAQNMSRGKCCIGRGVSAFRHAKFSEWYTYTYFKLRYLMNEIKKFNDEGTVFGSISKSDFEKIEVIIPPDEIVHEFELITKPINDKVIKNSFQIETLEKLRDTLLPKLMSGEVRVKYTPEAEQ